MTVSEKIKLIGLLDLYKEELAKKNVKNEKDKNGNVAPTKALFNHARIISNRLSADVERDLKSIWQN